MKSALYLTCALLFSSFHPGSEQPLEPGAPVPKPEVKMLDISGKEISLNMAKGANGLLVIFAGNKCPYMLRNQDRLRSICSFARSNSIGVIMINSNEANRSEEDSYSAMKAYAGAQSFNCYYVLDKNAEMAIAFDANHTPECYLFDKKSLLAYKGAIDDSPGNPEAAKVRWLQNAMNELLAGKQVGVVSSNSLGCNIKRKL